jgi:hypothetical protein
MAKASEPYVLSFTAASVCLPESVRLAELYAEHQDWDATREVAIANNVIQARKSASAKRICRELVFRLQGLSTDELGLLCHGNPHEQVQVLWISICRRYRLVAEFAVEVVRERFLTLGAPLTLRDFDIFYDRKADWAEELDKLAQSTRDKLRQVLFRMLREARLIDESGTIQPTLLSERLRQVVGPTRATDLDYFPAFEPAQSRRA